MARRPTFSSKPLRFSLRCILLLVAVTQWPGALGASSVTASKDCFTSPCTVVEAQFTLLVAQTIQWQATYTGSPTQGHSFYLSTVASNLADIPLRPAQFDGYWWNLEHPGRPKLDFDKTVICIVDLDVSPGTADAFIAQLKSYVDQTYERMTGRPEAEIWVVSHGVRQYPRANQPPS
jgi:hypothetical protein